MSLLRKSINRGRRDSKRRNGQLSPREIKADDVHNTLKKLKDTTNDCKELHRKWEKDKHFEKVNSDYLGQANKLLCVVDEYRQQLDLPWPKTKSTEIEELKTRVNKLARERDDAEYRLDEAKLEIDRLKNRPREKLSSGGKIKQAENMPKRRVEHDFDIEKEPDDSKRARKECSIDRRGPSRTPIHRHESASSQGAWRETEIIETLQKEIEELKKSMKILQEDNKSLSDGRANATKALNVARDEAARYKKQMEASDGTVARNQQEFEQLKIQFKDLHDSKKNDLQRKDELDRILQQSKANERNLQNALSAERQAKDEALISLRHGQSKEENLRDTIDRLQKNLSSEREAKDEALIRLSAVAGNKLRDNNPAITDLSDPNRPMKLAEKVSELYDNEWTNAMENLENDMEEKDAIEVLLDIVTNIFKTCEEIGDAQTDYISNLELPLAVPDIDDLRDVAKSSLLNKGKLAKLPTEITKPLKDYRKTSSLTVSPLLFEVMKSRLQTQYHLNDKTIKACEQFIKETVLYVWMMRVQDPPVHIEWEFSHGEKFDHDRLRSYTKGGGSVDYVVWPILYLHKDGPMLSKGVAQGMKTKSK